MSTGGEAKTRRVRRRAIATRPTLDRGMLKFSDEAEV